MKIRDRFLTAAAAAALALAALVATPTAASAVPPSNDDFANASVVGSYQVIETDNFDATMQIGEQQPSCQFTDQGGFAEASIWFAFTAPETKQINLDTLASVVPDTEITVYTGSALNNLTEVGCNEDVNPITNFRSQLLLPVTQGALYYVRVTTWAGDGISNTGPITLNISSEAPVFPDNDDSGAAQLIEPGVTEGSTIGATVDGADDQVNGLTGCPIGDSIWYLIQPDSSGTATVDLAGSSFDTAVAYLEQDMSSLEFLSSGCNEDDGGAQTSRITFAVAPGSQYYLQVGSTNGQEGSVQLDYSQASNDGDVSVVGKAVKAPGAQIAYQVSVLTDESGGSLPGQLTLKPPSGVKVGAVTSPDMTCAKGKSIVCAVPQLAPNGSSDVTVLVTPGSEGPFKLKATFAVAGPRPTGMARVDDPSNNSRTITATPAVVCDNKVTGKADKAKGGSGADILCGLAGDDRLDGAGGNDLIFGGDGADTLLGGAGTDTIVGGDGGDDIVGGSGTDTINGGGGTDRCREPSDLQQFCER